MRDLQNAPVGNWGNKPSGSSLSAKIERQHDKILLINSPIAIWNQKSRLNPEHQ